MTTCLNDFKLKHCMAQLVIDLTSPIELLLAIYLIATCQNRNPHQLKVPDLNQNNELNINLNRNRF